MQGVRQPNSFVKTVSPHLGGAPLRLISVGLESGDLEPGWFSFGAALSPLVVVEDPEQAAFTYPTLEGSVALADLSPPGPFWERHPFARFSDSRARVLQADDVEPLAPWLRRQLAGEPADAAANPSARSGVRPPPLADAVAAAGFGDANFLRLLAGWADHALLTQLGGFLASKTLQGVLVKLHLHGCVGANENSLHNVDRLLRQNGFEPFQLGWICLLDYGCHATHVTPYGELPFVDGVQSWINPALWSTRGG